MIANANRDIPQITSSMYCSTSGSPCAVGNLDMFRLDQGPLAPVQFNWPQGYQNQETKKEIEIMADKTNRRIVQVFIADPNENVPLDKSVLYTGTQKLTDLNDTELFFEVPIAELLKAHNGARVKFVDREASKRAGKDILLDPVKIRELKMVVVTVAQF